jgi:hypothetical protein
LLIEKEVSLAKHAFIEFIVSEQRLIINEKVRSLLVIFFIR